MFSQTYDFLRRQREWPLIFAFILFYKLGDTALNVMAAPFLLEIGFSKLEIAHVGKSFGIGAMIIGGLFAGMLLSQRSLQSVLLLWAGLQILSSFMFIVQASFGHNLSLLFVTIGLDNFACGMGAAAFITYLSFLSRNQYAATHFALLTSFASLCRVVFSFGAGWLADHVAWVNYFGWTAAACFLFFLLVLSQSQHIKHIATFKDTSLVEAA